MNALRIMALAALGLGVFALAISVGIALATGMAVARFWMRRTRGDAPVEPAAREPETIGVVLVPSAFHPGDLKVSPPGPAAFAAADALLEAHIRHHAAPAHCPRCGRRHDSDEGARFCYELRKEGATTP